MIVVPRKKPNDPDWGIKTVVAWGKTRYKVKFTEDGRKRIFTLKGATTIEEARTLRDTFFANLKARYEARVSSPGRTARKGMKGIYQRKPFYVKVDGVQIGEYDTLEEAKKARREYRKQ